MKLLYIILDGAADRPVKDLGNKTPLEAAQKPFLDSLAKYSKLGVMQVIGQKIAPESDEAMLSLLGFDPFAYHKGRGPLEAAGAGIKFKPGDIVLRCNFAKEEHGFVIDTEVTPPKKELRKITNLLQKITDIGDVKIKFSPTVGHRAVLILTGKGLSPRVSNTYASYKIVQNFVTTSLPKINLRFENSKPLDSSKEAAKTAHIINYWTNSAREILASHKIKSANLVLLRGAGSSLPKLKKLQGRWALLADMPVERAIGKLAGMTVIKTKGLRNTAKNLLLNWKRFDKFYFELKGADSFAHKGDAIGKKDFIEKIDYEFFKPILSNIDLKDVIICVTADHTTACETKAHTADFVPVMIYNTKIRGDNINKFSEVSCRLGSLRFTSATNLFGLLQKW